MSREPESTLLTTADGSPTVRHALLGELYHSDRGAVGEARHVYIEAGLEYVLQDDRDFVSVFEVGFGTGLNCLLTARTARKRQVRVDYRAVELYPLGAEMTSRLDYAESAGERDFFDALHAASWDERVPLGGDFALTKLRMDIEGLDTARIVAAQADVIYFDAFAPDAQPGLWSGQVMEQMYRLLRPGGVLVTYSAKGAVKQALRSAGFEVFRLPGALGKRHMLRAARPLPGKE